MTDQEKYLAIAEEIREDPERWTQGWYARNQDGFRSGPQDPHACQWCVMGFVFRDEINSDPLYRALEAQAPYNSIPSFNDHPKRTAEEIADLFEAAAIIASNEENPDD